MLALNNVEVIYDHVILVLKGVSLAVPRGAIVALLGANGAGKSTTLKAISNLLLGERGKVTKGSVEFMGARVDGLSPSELVRHAREKICGYPRCAVELRALVRRVVFQAVGADVPIALSHHDDTGP